jgi:hypothetical protein
MNRSDREVQRELGKLVSLLTDFDKSGKAEERDCVKIQMKVLSENLNEDDIVGSYHQASDLTIDAALVATFWLHDNRYNKSPSGFWQ